MAQSAVEWLSNQAYELFEQYLEGNYNRRILNDLMLEAIIVAKKIEKEQHSDTWDKALDTLEQRGVYIRAWEDFDEYYNNKFKK